MLAATSVRDVVSPTKRRRNTGPSRKVRDLVREREGDACARCGLRDGGHVWPRHQIHHRRPRGLGSSRAADTNDPPNLVLLCALACHGFVESYRAQATMDGWLVRQGHDPATVPVLYRGSWRLLEADGSLGAVLAGPAAA